MNIIRSPLSKLLLCFVFVPCFAQTYFPETGPDALHQRSLDVRSRLNVLFLSLQPGYEDFAALAYFRMARGAKVTNAYVTNGEAGESDIRGEYPMTLAGIRREEATQAMASIDGEAYFLNMPDIAAAPDSASVRTKWQADTLQLRLMKLISDFRPDIILVTRDWARGSTSPQWEVLRSDLLKALQRLEPPKSEKDLLRFDPFPRWTVERVCVDRGSKTGARVSVGGVHPRWRKSYVAIGEEAARAYVSLARQRKLWRTGPQDSSASKVGLFYELAYPPSGRAIRKVDQDLPRPVPARFGWIERELLGLTSAASKGGTSESLLRRLAAIMDSLDLKIALSSNLAPMERKILLQWKLGLENLRIVMLGIKVSYTLRDSILTKRQITFLRIDSARGIPAGGTTEIFFPFTDQGWIVNESWVKRMPVKYGEDYRLLSPERIDFNYPRNEYGLTQASDKRTLLFFIIHKGAKREQSFVYRGVLKLLFAPRFTVEILTPIVRVVPSERIIVQLTNHSRDGVRDTVFVNDSLAASNEGPFRLNVKGQVHRDTLWLMWKRTLDDGTYLIPVHIREETVAGFAARKFDVRIDSSKRVGLVTGLTNSPTEDALRRLAVKWDRLTVDEHFSEVIPSYQVILIDRRALTLVEQLAGHRSVLERFVERGGHLIVLAQDASVWNTLPIVDGIRLAASQTFDEQALVEIDSTHDMVLRPNPIARGDWSDWLYARAYNLVSGEELSSASVPVRMAKGKNPLIATWRRGGGTITYCDLAFHPQFLNIHPGAFRLLANLISY
jgi:hypothetical protein